MYQIPLLPYPSFRKSVACYSDNMLVETLRLLCACSRHIDSNRRDVSYRARDVWHFWSGWKQAYIRLGMMCAEEATLRDVSYDREKAARLFRGKRGKHWEKPHWVSWEPLHSNHRGILLHIGEVERVNWRIICCEKLEDASYEIQDNCIKNWYEMHGFDSFAEGDKCYVDEVNDFLNAQGAPLPDADHPNHYNQFNWTELPCGAITAFPPEPGSAWLVS